MNTPIPFFDTLGWGSGRKGEYYYSQGMTRSRFGLTPGWKVTVKKSSDDISGLGNIKYFAQRSADGKLYAQDANGDIHVETTAGAMDFPGTPDRTASGNGHGMIGDQKGRLLYAQESQIGMYDGSWTDAWKTGLDAAQHPMETFESGVYGMNANKVFLIASDDSMNNAAFTMPTDFVGLDLCAGKNGLLLGFNWNYQGILVLWDGLTDRSIAPWIWTTGEIQSIDRWGEAWLVLTSRELILTNGYSSQILFGVPDDPLGFTLWEANPQGLLVVNDQAIILQQKQVSQQAAEFGRFKPGVYIFDLLSKTFEYAPVHTGNTITVTPQAAFLTKSYSLSIALGYHDVALNKNYISTLDLSGPSSALVITDKLGAGATEKVTKSATLNLGLRSEAVLAAAPTFDVSVKVYDFKRALWGRQLTTATGGSAAKIRVNGTDATYYNAAVGDEVTVLSGPNAGLVRHIESIANDGASGEEWTLTSALPNTTASAVHIQVMPFKLADSKVTVSSAAELGEFLFNIENNFRGKKFLLKILFEGMNCQPELHESLLTVEDLGITSS